MYASRNFDANKVATWENERRLQTHLKHLKEIRSRSVHVNYNPAVALRNSFSRLRVMSYLEAERIETIRRENQLLMRKLVAIAESRPGKLRPSESHSMNINRQRREGDRTRTENTFFSKHLLKQEALLSKKKLSTSFDVSMQSKDSLSKAYQAQNRFRLRKKPGEVHSIAESTSEAKLSTFTGSGMKFHHKLKSEDSKDKANLLTFQSVSLEESPMGITLDQYLSSKCSISVVSDDKHSKHKVRLAVEMSEEPKGKSHLSKSVVSMPVSVRADTPEAGKSGGRGQKGRQELPPLTFEVPAESPGISGSVAEVAAERESTFRDSAGQVVDVRLRQQTGKGCRKNLQKSMDDSGNVELRTEGIEELKGGSEKKEKTAAPTGNEQLQEKSPKSSESQVKMNFREDAVKISHSIRKDPLPAGEVDKEVSEEQNYPSANEPSVQNQAEVLSEMPVVVPRPDSTFLEAGEELQNEKSKEEVVGGQAVDTPKAGPVASKRDEKPEDVKEVTTSGQDKERGGVSVFSLEQKNGNRFEEHPLSDSPRCQTPQVEKVEIQGPVHPEELVVSQNAESIKGTDDGSPPTQPEAPLSSTVNPIADHEIEDPSSRRPYTHLSEMHQQASESPREGSARGISVKPEQHTKLDTQQPADPIEDALASAVEQHADSIFPSAEGERKNPPVEAVAKSTESPKDETPVAEVDMSPKQKVFVIGEPELVSQDFKDEWKEALEEIGSEGPPTSPLKNERNSKSEEIKEESPTPRQDPVQIGSEEAQGAEEVKGEAALDQDSSPKSATDESDPPIADDSQLVPSSLVVGPLAASADI